MMNILKVWSKRLFAIEFLKFIVVGLINTFNGVWLSLVYSLFFQDNVAFVAGYLTSLTISYLLNSCYTFHESFTWKKYVKFCISYIPNFIIQNAIIAIFMNGLGWHKIIVFGMAAVIGLPITYLCAKYFAFKNRAQ